jgi:polyisoprenoid-binding protein YceI
MLIPIILISATAGIITSPPTPRLAPSPRVVQADSIVWRIDPNHSELSFRIRHFVSRVHGTFASWQGTIIADPDNLAEGSVKVVIDASSIDTNNERRDSDLRSDDFFDVAKYPNITFTSSSVQISDGELTIAGNLTMHGVTKPVVLTGSYNGIARNPRGDRIGFEASATIDRLQWGVTWNRIAEGGGAMLGDEVEVEIAIEAIRQAPQ